MTAPAGLPGDRPAAAVSRLCVGVFGAGLVTLLGFTVASPGWHPLRVLVLFGLLLAVQLRPHRLLHHGQHALGIQLDELLFVPMAVLLSPPETIAVFAVTLAVAQIAQHKVWSKTLFNIGQVMVAAGAGLAVCDGLMALAGHGDVEKVFAGVGGAAVFALISAVAVAGIVSFVQRCPFVETLAEQWSPRLLAVGGSVSLGGMAALAVEIRPAALVLILAPALLVQSAYALALDQAQEWQRSEALHAAAKQIRVTLDVATVRQVLVDTARTLLGAETAHLVPKSAPALPGALRADVDDTWDLEVASRVGGGGWEHYDDSALRSLGSIGHDALRNAELFGQIEAITHSQGEGVIALDGQRRITFINSAAERMLRGTASGDSLVGRQADEVFWLEVAGHQRDHGALTALLAGAVIREDDAVLRRQDATVVPVAYTAAPLLAGGDPGASGAVIAIRDITERKAFEEQLAYQAYHDPLTGLPNRRLFLDRLAHAVARPVRDDIVHGLLTLDLDRFKLVNDSLGHATGDDLLVAVADRLAGHLQPADTFARLGGDEFTILVEDLTDPAALSVLAGRLVEAMEAPFQVRGHELFTSVSVGIAHTGDPVARVDLMSSADAALYQAKAHGKNRFAVFSGKPSEEALAQLEIEAGLRRAVERDELELYYQPITEATTGALRGVETLVRWNTPQGDMMSPGSFVPLAEETGLILPIGWWVLAKAARDTQAWTVAHQDRPPLTVSVNLSARQFAHPGVVGEIASTLARSGLAPGQLCLEITEGVIMEDTDATIGRLRQLKALGVKLAIDDFGTGYSSLSYLKRFPVDSVKIDQSFVAGLTTSAVDFEIVAAVIRLASAIGITAVAEGVETPEQLALLAQLGCPLVQGHFLSPPLPLAAFLSFCDGRVAPEAVMAAAD